LDKFQKVPIYKKTFTWGSRSLNCKQQKTFLIFFPVTGFRLHRIYGYFLKASYKTTIKQPERDRNCINWWWSAVVISFLTQVYCLGDLFFASASFLNIQNSILHSNHFLQLAVNRFLCLRVNPTSNFQIQWCSFRRLKTTLTV